MKKENIILIKFIAIMAVATAGGVLRGRLALPLAKGEIFLPQAITIGPVLVIAALFGLIKSVRNKDSNLINQWVTVAFTGFGMVLTGCCGFYKLADVAFVAVTALFFIAVMAVALYARWASPDKVHRGKPHHSTAEKIAATVFFAVMGLCLFVPAGPVAVLVAGTVWLVTGKNY